MLKESKKHNVFTKIKTEKLEANDYEVKGSKKRRSEVLVLRDKKMLYRRAFSETQLLDILGFDFKYGEIYNCITAGDVDALSYLKTVIRQQNLDYCLISTWVMAADDILQIEDWLKNGVLKKIDIYLGEVFPRNYVMEFDKLKEIFNNYNCGRIAVFKNHSKIFAGYGDKFYFGIQTSANVNTNPRTENGSITISKDIYEFYKNYFDGIKSFE